MSSIKISKIELVEALKDTLLTERCNTFTRDMLKCGMSIDKICMYVKDYQRKYIYMKQQGADCSAFTFEVWWNLGQRGDGKFALAK